ncbi:MAG: ROK family protein [Parvibaculum sp.]|uniref:ROK family protein n=1 Tax=Parvibaculum sp. TaxID=2024848 RepID=UPI0025D96800|nr:ROK family protein [Parvibaculum sp.]MCE9650680.1 ROK family protein [Parvibaculum sp.]
MTASRSLAPCRLGVDMGGTKIAGVLLDDAGEELAAERIAMPQQAYSETLHSVAGLISRLARRAPGPITIGVGLPGTLDSGTECVKHCNATWLNHRPFGHDLRQLIGHPLRFANDGDCFALSEAVDGTGAGEKVVLGVVLGTGCGGGIAIDGRIVPGRHGLSAELGHVPVPHGAGRARRGEACFCGGRDCLEQYVSGTAISRFYREESGRSLTVPQIHDLAEAGEPAAMRLLDETEDVLARSLALFITVLDPDVIVLGGGLSNMARIYRNLPPLVRKHCPFLETDTPIQPPRWGDASGARGAAWLWRQGAQDQA